MEHGVNHQHRRPKCGLAGFRYDSATSFEFSLKDNDAFGGTDYGT